MFDIFVLVLLGIGAFRGFKKGLLIEIIGIVAFIIAIVASFKLLHVGIDFLIHRFGSFSHLIPYIAFIMIFLLVLVGISLLGRMVKKILDYTLLGSIDNFAGGVVGILKMAIAISILLWLTQTVGFTLPESIRQNSKLYEIISPLGPKVVSIIGSLIPYSGDLIDSIRDLIQPTN